MRHHNTALLGILASLACSTQTNTTPDNLTQPIIGGIVDEGHPYVVAVGDAFEPFCTGTVISRRTVLTAGHCFGGITRVYFGTNLEGPVVGVTAEIRHPDYDEFTLANDLALLKLAEDAPVQPAPLLREEMSNSLSFVGPKYTFVGYGATDGFLQADFGVRRVVTFPIDFVGPGEVASDVVGFVDENQFYYESTDKQTCVGDSGGPAFIIRGGVERHAGATSYGDAGCAIDGVQMMTDLTIVTDFIQPLIDQFEANDPCRADGLCDASCQTDSELVDPDCAENHCEADGVCALACVKPLDPDCAAQVANLCGEDGVCDPSCETVDEDCKGLCGAEGTCVESCANAPDPDCGGAPTCGDGVVAEGEGCDDGNTTAGDGCDASCQAENNPEEEGLCAVSPNAPMQPFVWLFALLGLTLLRRRSS
jgi:cysteine-rich repeat protein